MHSFVSIVGVVLIDKETYLEQSRKINHTLIFSDLWDGICDRDTSPIKPTIDTELVISMIKDKKSYALIASFMSEDASCHTRSIKDSWGALKKMKYFHIQNWS